MLFYLEIHASLSPTSTVKLNPNELPPLAVLFCSILAYRNPNHGCKFCKIEGFMLFWHIWSKKTVGFKFGQLLRKRDTVLTPVLPGVDRTILWINHNPIEDSVGFDATYPKDSPLSTGWHYATFNNWDMLCKPYHYYLGEWGMGVWGNKKNKEGMYWLMCSWR